jgi:hypothetical protein
MGWRRLPRAGARDKFSAMTIDTLDCVKKLEAAGVDRKAAEAHAEVLRGAIAEELATKADISRLEAGISHLEAKIDTKSSELRAEIMKYMIAQTFVMIGVFFTLLRLVR